MPLAHLLAPQIAKKVNQVETDLGRTGYLSHAAPDVADRGATAPNWSPDTSGKLPPGYNRMGDQKVEQIRKETEAQAKQYDPRGVMGRPKMPGLYDPNTPGGSMIQLRGALGNIGGAAAQRGFDRGSRMGITPEGNLGQKPDHLTLIPNAPVPKTKAYLAQGQPQTLQLGGKTITINPGDVTDERGMPVALPAAKPKTDKKGRQIITLPKDMQAINEYGEPVDKKGKKVKTGYLDRDPHVQFPTADPMDPTQTGGAKMIERFPGAAPVLERRYRQHLEAMQANRDEQGMPTDKLPKGYFESLGRERGKPLSKDEQKDIMNGIEALRKMEKGVSI